MSDHEGGLIALPGFLGDTSPTYLSRNTLEGFLGKLDQCLASSGNENSVSISGWGNTGLLFKEVGQIKLSTTRLLGQLGKAIRLMVMAMKIVDGLTHRRGKVLRSFEFLGTFGALLNERGYDLG
jgi:hypothetical protein